ncbi:Two-component system response regulator DesR OS=Streptomyces albaduncus OX=68172 GN=FHS32_003238 PE=4 SV=1 [Streptomyces griseoloalbus]
MVRTVVVHDEELLRSALVQLLRSDAALEVSSRAPGADLPDRDELPTDV